MESLIQLREYPIKDVLKQLLIDKTTKGNIVFATTSYEHFGDMYAPQEHIYEDSILGLESCEIQPRISKSKHQQRERTKEKAEVFTPSWICNKINNYCDNDWFQCKDVFNIEKEDNTWVINEEKVKFPSNKTWKEYVDTRYIEITCGEAPFLVSRYDPATGEIILPINRRIGVLDRKLRVVSENTTSKEEWMKWVIRAYQSVYGYEWQGDSLLIARINLLLTFVDYMIQIWGKKPTYIEINKITNIISWNIWQMNGLNASLPYSDQEKTLRQMSVFDNKQSNLPHKNPVLTQIYDWRKKRSFEFSSVEESDEMAKLFSYCIGNPPYQEETSEESEYNGQKSKKNIFHYFQIQADKITKEGSALIYPGGRWIHRSGKGLTQFGLATINDPKLARLDFYPNSKELFSSNEITDGISIVVKKKNKVTPTFEYSYILKGKKQSVSIEYPGEDLIPLNPDDMPIASKIDNFVKMNKLEYLNKAILPRTLFGIESNFVQKNPFKVREFREGKDFNPEEEIKVLANDKAGSAGRAVWFIASKGLIKKNIDYISQWQVVVSSAHGGGQDGRDNQLEIIDNKSVFGRSRVALKSFPTELEAKNFYNYMKTDLVKFTFLLTDEALTSLGKRVPDLLNYDFSSKFLDFNFDLNKQLFHKIGLSSEEIDYISTRIRD